MVDRVEENPQQEMPLPDYLAWPFFESYHQEIAKSIRHWASTELCQLHSDDTDAVCRDLVRQLGESNWLCYCVAGLDYGGFSERIDTRTVCLMRETLARYSGLADFSFAMQGLGAGAISLFGTKAQRANYLPKVAKGQSIAAFALSEP